MIDRLVLGLVLFVVGCNGLFPDKPQSTEPTVKQLKAKARERQLSEICQRRKGQKQSKVVKEMCAGWQKHQ